MSAGRLDALNEMKIIRRCFFALLKRTRTVISITYAYCR